MFGITSKSRKLALNKVDNVRLFMDNNFIEIGGKTFAYSQFCKNSFINSNRYIAEINNRVNSLFNYAQVRDLKNVFGTLTLPTEFHRLKTLKSGKKVTNKKYGGRKILFICKHPITKKKIKFDNPEENREKHYPKQAVKVLTKMFEKIRHLRSYRDISKDYRVYFRVTEPHKDGCPHLHISIFIPDGNVSKFVNDVKELYPAPACKIETDVKNPVAYLMKYILKTLDDLRADNQKITDLTLWYILHGICRIYTSRTLISLDVYRVLGGRYSLNELSVMYKDKEISILLCSETNKPMEIFNEYGSIWSRKKSVNNVTYDKRKLISKTLERNKLEVPIKIHKDNRDYHYYRYEDELIELPIVPAYMKDYELANYYNSLDTEEVESLIHFGITQNECIKRGLIDGKIQSLNGFNTNITSEDYTMTKFNEVGILDTKTQPLPNIDKEYFGLPKTDIVLPEDFDYSFTKNEDEVIEKFPQSYFDFDDKNIGV